MAVSQNSKSIEAIKLEIQARVTAGLEHKAKVINGKLKIIVNKKIDRMLQEMAGVGQGSLSRVVGVSGFPSQLKSSAVPWKPLDKQYVKNKGNDQFFKNTGDLIDSVFASQQRYGKSPSHLFGGYSTKSFRSEKIDNVTRQDINKVKGRPKNNIKLQFTIFGELQRRKIPETIFDGAGFTLDSPPTRKGKVVRNPIALKLGVYKGKRLRYYRSLISPYAKYYAKRVIPKTVKAYLRTLT